MAIYTFLTTKACNSVDGDTVIHDNACTGDGCCTSFSGPKTVIYSGSCTDHSCHMVRGYFKIYEDSCQGPSACSSVDGNTLIYSRSCLETQVIPI